MFTRRKIVTTAAIAAPVVALGACANLTSSQVQNDAQLISSGLSGIVADLQNIPGLVIPADVLAKVNGELTIIGQNAQQIGSLVGSSPAVAINTAVGVVAAALTPFFPAAPMVAVAVQAAVTLAATLVGSFASAAASKMSVAQARAYLTASATH
jgi:hypothetical protein